VLRELVERGAESTRELGDCVVELDVVGVVAR